jgi:prevent-host-death family protein
MKLSEQLPLADVKSRLSEVVDRVEREHDRIVITRYGRPAAVMLSIDDLESLEETLQILSDPNLMADIQQARSSAPTPMSRVDALAMIRAR